MTNYSGFEILTLLEIDCDENWMDLGNLRPTYLGHQGSILGSSIFVLHNLSALQSRRKI